MDASRSKILCPIKSLVIQNTLLILVDFSQTSKEYKEDNLLQVFQESSVEQKETLLKTFSKPEIQFLNKHVLIYYNLVNEETQSLITLASQFLGMDMNKFITKPLLSLILILSTGQVGSNPLSQSMQSSCLKFDDFLAENIHSQLINFHKTRYFRFQSFLLRIFLTFNEDNLQLLEMVITYEMSRDYCKFMNFLMAPVYNVLFQERLPRVLLEMKEILQLSPKRRI